MGPLGAKLKNLDNGNKVSFNQTLDSWIMISHKLAADNQKH